MKYVIRSPDGLPMHSEDTEYDSEDEAMRHIQEFVKRYDEQGYYRTRYGNAIDTSELTEHFRIRPATPTEGE